MILYNSLLNRSSLKSNLGLPHYPAHSTNSWATVDVRSESFCYILKHLFAVWSGTVKLQLLYIFVNFYTNQLGMYYVCIDLHNFSLVNVYLQIWENQ